jgi:hypothetical protein
MAKGLPRSLSRGNPQLQEVIKQTFTINDTVTITGVEGAVDAGELVIGGLPEGNILLLGAVSYVKVDGGTDANIINNWNGDYAIGTVPNSNDVDVGDAGEADIIPSTPLDAGASDKATPLTRGVSTTTLSGVIFDNTAGDLELNLNILIDDNVITDTEDGVFTVTGHLHLAYIVLGDD